MVGEEWVPSDNCMKIDKNRYDVSGIFSTYMSFVGDADQTAAALSLDPQVVVALATQEGWVEKVKHLSQMSKAGKPGDFEKAANRALNFVQAHRLRGVLTALLTNYEAKAPEDLAEVSTNAKTGVKTVTCKFFADLASAMERVHQLSYAALGDSIAERNARLEEDGSEVSGDTLHRAVFAALNSPAVSGIEPKDIMKQAQQEYAKEVVALRVAEGGAKETHEDH